MLKTNWIRPIPTVDPVRIPYHHHEAFLERIFVRLNWQLGDDQMLLAIYDWQNIFGKI